MAVSFSLIPVNESDEPFINELYASTRAEEMAVVPWSDQQKQTFLRMQSEAQNLYYRELYPTASFNIINSNDQPVGRFYVAELVDEIRIIDLAFLPQFFDKDIFIKLVEDVLQKAGTLFKPVQIYLESFDPMAEIFADLGFQKVGEHGIYFLWRRAPVLAKAAVKTSLINA